MKKIRQAFLIMVFAAVFMVTILGAQAFASFDDISLNASLSPASLEVSDSEQAVTLTLTSSEPITLDGVEYQIVPSWEGYTITSTAGVGNAAFTAGDIGEKNGNYYITWGTDDSENITANSFGTFSITVPANTPAGDYTVQILGFESTKDYGDDGYQGGATATLTITDNGVEPPDPVTDAMITVADADGTPGEELSIPISIVNNPGVISIELTVVYDSSLLEWTDVQEGDFGGVFDAEVGQKITWYADDPRTDFDSDGVFATLVFRVKDDAVTGVTEVKITEVTVTYSEDDIFDSDEENVDFGITAGEVTISTHIPGDINGDGEVNNKDITRLMRYIKYKDVEVVTAALDVNGDGTVNNKDVTRLMRYVKYYDVDIY